MPVDVQVNTAALRNIATQLRIDSVKSTSEAGSGHPTTCCSAAEIVSTIFFGEMRYDPKEPQSDQNDRFVLSKGHAAPILYAAWAEAGLFPRSDVMKLREFTSDLEGHPTPRLPWSISRPARSARASRPRSASRSTPAASAHRPAPTS